MPPLPISSDDGTGSSEQAEVIALFETDPVRAAAAIQAVSQAGRQIIALGDPALSVRDWLACPFDLVLCNPFASVGAPHEIMSLVRRLAASRPLFALTMSDCVEQRTLAIVSGADDAIEPMSAPQELATRVFALLRRKAMNAGLLACDELQVDLLRRTVQRGMRPIALPTREFELLAELARTPDEVVPRAHLLRAVWRLDFDPGTNRVEVHMSRLRSRLDAGEKWSMLRTYKAQGYALVSRSGVARSLSVAAA